MACYFVDQGYASYGGRLPGMVSRLGNIVCLKKPETTSAYLDCHRRVSVIC